MGIEQLVDAFKGNPQPLEAKVQKDQQGQKPGELPKDLEEAIALQKIANLKQGAQNQQAIQAGGAQPSVVEKLRQMLASAEQRQQAQPMPGQPPQFQPPQGQPQMAQGQPPMPQGPQGGPPPAPQGQPVMAAHGGSIDQLMSNLGRHYAGGGIVAFDEGDLVVDPMGGVISSTKQPVDDLTFLERIGLFNPENRRAIERGEREQREREAKQREREALGLKPGEVERGRQPDPRSAANRFPDAETQLAEAAAITAAQNKPRVTSSGAGNAGIAGGKPTEAMDPMEAAIRANIMKEMGKNEDEEWKKGAGRYEQFMGLDKLLQPREARIAERQEMMKKIQGERTPAWVEALAAAGRPVRGGIGTLINQMGSAAESTRKGYSAEDLKFFDDIGAMQDEVVKLKLEGKTKAAAAGEASIKDAIANKRQAEQSGTSLLNTKENVRSREQLARDAAASRAQSAKQHADNQALALEERKRQFDETQLRKIREKDVERAAKIESEITKRTGLIDMQLQNPNLDSDKAAKLVEQREAIVKQVMAAYPSVKPEVASAKPSVGTITGGYKYKGGDPADRNNWEKV